MTGNPLEVDSLVHRRLMGSWVTGVSLVTSTDADGHPSGCTLNALTSLSLEPPSLVVALGTESRTLTAVRESGRFCVNVLAGDQEDVARCFASSSLSVAERFATVDYELRDGVPVIMDCVTTLVCDVTDVIPIHDHVLIAGLVRLAWHDEARLPLVFFGGRFAPPVSAAV